MIPVVRIVIIAFFALNALFWGLFPHSKHCAFVALFGVSNCPPHALHIMMGILFFVAAVLIAQWDHVTIMHKK